MSAAYEAYPNDVDRLMAAAQRHGATEHLTRAEVADAWQEYSTMLDASWMIVIDSSTWLSGFLLGYVVAQYKVSR